MSVSHIKSPPTIRSSRFEACECDPVDEQLPLFPSRVNKKSHAASGAHLKEPSPQKAVLHLALCLIEGCPGHYHRAWHS